MTIHVAFQPNAYRDPVPAGAGGTFDSFVSVLRELVDTEHACADLADRRSVDAAKASMPAVIPARLSPERMAARLERGEKTARGSEVVEGSALVGLDIDKAPAEAIAVALERLKAGNVAAVVHGSPTDGVDPSVRKVRIYVQADRELGPSEIWPARVAWATALGLREWLDPQTSDPSRLFFAGRLAGTPPREFVVTGSTPVPIDPLLRAFPAPPAPSAPATTTTANSSATPGTAPIIWAAGAEHEQRMTPALVALLAPEYDRGGRHAKSRALGAVLALSGWSLEAIAELVRSLPSDRPDFRAEQAVDAAKRATAGDAVPQHRALAQAFGQRTADLVTAIAKQPVVVELEAATATASAEPVPTPTRIKIRDISAEIPPVNWLCERLRIAPGAPTIVAGYGGLGKSMLVQLLIVCAVVGRPCLTHPVRKGHVLHLDYEQGPHETESRYKRLAADIGLRGNELEDGLDILSPPPFNLLSQNAESAFTELCRHYDLVVIDSLRAATPGLNENDSEIRAPLDMLFRVSVATGCTIIVIHHARKSTKENGDAGGQNMRGNSAINDAAQAVIMLEPIADGFRITPGKVRIGRKFDPIDVAIQDCDVEGVPFKGLRLHVTDGSALEQALRKEELARDEQTVFSFLSGQPASKFEGNARDVWAAMGKPKGTTRERIADAVKSLIRAHRVQSVRGNLIVTLGTPGVTLDPNGTPTTKAP